MTIRQSEPEYINGEQYKQDMQEHNELYFVAIRFPAKFVIGEYEQADGTTNEYLTITMTRPHWHEVANMVIHDIENNDE